VTKRNSGLRIIVYPKRKITLVIKIGEICERKVSPDKITVTWLEKQRILYREQSTKSTL
jgi:hypothetical protein